MSQEDEDTLEKLGYGVLIPYSKLNRELNQWRRWVTKYPKCKVIVTRNNISVGVFAAHSCSEEYPDLPQSFVDDIHFALEKSNHLRKYKWG